jgi:hypothetical protein
MLITRLKAVAVAVVSVGGKELTIFEFLNQVDMPYWVWCVVFLIVIAK